MKKSLLIKLLTLILSLCTVFCFAVGCDANGDGQEASDEVQVGTEGLAYMINAEKTGYYVTGAGMAEDSNIVIPSTYKGLPVVGIAEIAFYNNDLITSVIIGDNVISIGYGAFCDCGSLTSVIIPSSVISIGGSAFEECSSLISISIGNGVVSIGNGAFNDCDLLIYNVKDGLKYLGNESNEYLYLAGVENKFIKTATINSNCKFIGSSVFSECSSLTSIIIPNSVTSIADGAFEDCSSLIKVNYLGAIDSWVQIEFCDSYSNPLCFAGKLYMNDVLVTETTLATAIKISAYAFYNCDSLTSIVIPNSVKSIGEKAFYNCDSLTSIVIPNSVKSIGEKAFYDCNSLLPIYCEVESNPNGWDEDWKGSSTAVVVWDCNNNDVAEDGYIYTTVNGIRYALKNQEAMVTKQNKKITTVDIPSSITYRGVSYSVTSIGNYAFSCCSLLTNVGIPNSVTSIGIFAFSGCSSLTNIVIPNSVTSIGYSVFYGSFLVIYCELESQPGSWDNDWNVYWGSGSNGKEYCPAVWACNNNDIANDGYIHTIIDGIYYKIKDENAMVFSRHTVNITTVNIPSIITHKGVSYSVTSIGAYAFNGCRSLTRITIPDSVTSIGESAFRYCDSLETIYCEAESQPSGWDSFWNEGCSANVVWGYKG